MKNKLFLIGIFFFLNSLSNASAQPFNAWAMGMCSADHFSGFRQKPTRIAKHIKVPYYEQNPGSLFLPPQITFHCQQAFVGACERFARIQFSRNGFGGGTLQWTGQYYDDFADPPLWFRKLIAKISKRNVSLRWAEMTKTLTSLRCIPTKNPINETKPSPIGVLSLEEIEEHYPNPVSPTSYMMWFPVGSSRGIWISLPYQNIEPWVQELKNVFAHASKNPLLWLALASLLAAGLTATVVGTKTGAELAAAGMAIVAFCHWANIPVNEDILLFKYLSHPNQVSQNMPDTNQEEIEEIQVGDETEEEILFLEKQMGNHFSLSLPSQAETELKIDG